MKARVLFVDQAGNTGGAELMLLDLAEAYRETSTVVLLSEGPFRERLEERGVTVRVLPGSSALHAVRREGHQLPFKAGWDAIRLALKMVPLARRHDCLHANTQKAFAIACLTGAIARRPVIWSLHDLLAKDQFSPLHIKIDVMLANRCADVVMANSHASAQALVQNGGYADKIHVHHNGIDAAPFDAVTYDQVAETREELGITDVPALGVFGRLAEWKGQHVALEALQSLSDTHLVVVGDALFGEDAYAAALRDRAQALGVADRVHFTGFRRDVPQLMRAVDIVLHTSTAPEPFGRVIVEGMLSRRPVVATRGGGADEIVDSGVTGMLVTPGDPHALATAVRKLFAEPAHAWAMARAGRKAALERFSLAAMVNGMSARIEQMVHS